MSRRREVPDDIVEDESILDDIGEDEDYSDDDDFDEEEIPPLEISSARRNRPPTATRRAEVSPSGGLATPPPSALFGGDTLQRRLDTESDEDPYRDEEPFEREDNESPLATHEPMITLTRSPLEGGAPLPLSASVANAAMLSPEISGMMNVATRSVTSDSTADDDYDHVEAFDLFDTTTQSHHQMYDIVTALLASSSEESANVVRSAGAGTISSSYGGAQHSTTAASSTTTASPPIDLHYRRQQEISKKRAELLGALYRPAYQLSILSADESQLSGIVPPFLASLQASLQDFVASPLFSSSECAELLLGPIIHKGGNPVGLKALLLVTVERSTPQQQRPPPPRQVHQSICTTVASKKFRKSALSCLALCIAQHINSAF
ncbi:Hypothetical protein, putative [Bodo saltans]|uniref:Uncharacterized protein n=1 Tax=Bodo saltans TaxID=75058 RepID=A0A0S4J5C2_BODSA|nr:Hypothetical protein, putative [Bodo saltans]|eukprot:CUG81542.1 Hypothetical protein, putative [Bodo saltans]